MKEVILSIENATATVTLNRPNLHNAFNEQMIASLIECFDSIAKNSEIRVMILQSNGKSFSAGADLNWMKKMASYSESENFTDAQNLARMLYKLRNLPQPTIAKVQGAAFGGAVGLVACCDIVIASRLSKFCLSEVKLGLIPATIAPYVIRAVGARTAKRLFITAEIISARRARRIGLVSETVSEEEIDSQIETIVSAILKNGPVAVQSAKSLVHELEHKAIDEDLLLTTSQQIARIRVSEEGQEGLQAFLDKRPAKWINSHD